MPIIALILFILVSGTAKAEMLNTFSAQVERTLVEHNKEEIVKGIIYYQAPNNVVVEVHTPLEQIMAITDKVMLIYYPNAKKAFRIKSKNPIPPPFIQTIIGAMKEDYGLIKQGYTFIKHEKKGDTLYTYWEPPSKQKKNLGVFILGTLSNKLVYAEAQIPDGTPAVKSFYQKHLQFGDSYIPLDISSEYYNESDIMREHIIFSDVKFNPVIPDHILEFKIPDGIPVKEVEW
jgi:outer membrane lipoprotein-sorting protein